MKHDPHADATPVNADQGQFVAYLQEEVPALRDAGATDWAKVNAIREWAYRRIPRANPSAMLTLSESMPLRDRFRSFDELSGGFACGGTAHILADIYRSLGYEAHTYDMGVRGDGLTHMLTVVGIEHDGRQVLSVQDAYFNFTVSAKNGTAPADLRDVLALLAIGDVSSVVIESGTEDCKPAVTRAENLEGDRLYHAQYYRLGPAASRNGMAQYCHDFSLETYERLGEYTAWIDSQIGKDDLLYLFLFPLSTEGGDDIRQIAEQAKIIQHQLRPSRGR